MWISCNSSKPLSAEPAMLVSGPIASAVCRSRLQSGFFGVSRDVARVWEDLSTQKRSLFHARKDPLHICCERSSRTILQHPYRFPAVRTALIKFRFESDSRPSSSHPTPGKVPQLSGNQPGRVGPNPRFPIAVIQKLFLQHFKFPEFRHSATCGCLNKNTTLCLVEDHRAIAYRIAAAFISRTTCF
jgi:hypothetical protein